MAITDLTGYTWVGNETIDISNSFTYSLNFVNDSNTYTSIEVVKDFGTELHYGAISVYSDRVGIWNLEAYRTIQITGGTDATNSTLIAWLEANGTLTAPEPTPLSRIQNAALYIKKTLSDASSITDLTGTTWVFNDSPDLDIRPSGISINFSSYGRSFDFISFSMQSEGMLSRMSYSGDGGNTIAYTAYLNGAFVDTWENEELKTIRITGGYNATNSNSDLISWLQANATLIEGGPTITFLQPIAIAQKATISGGTVSDLTNTSWHFNATPDVSMMMAGPFYLEFTSNNTNYISLNYGRDGPMSFIRYTSGTGGLYVYYGDALTWTDEAYRTISITGGTDATNGNLIAWLQANAILTSGGVSLQPLAIGYTSEAQVLSLISFTIDTTPQNSTTYQAESGMTWYEWCNSEYNDGDYSCDNSNISYVIYWPMAQTCVAYGNNPVKGKDTIIQNANYLRTPIGAVN